MTPHTLAFVDPKPFARLARKTPLAGTTALIKSVLIICPLLMTQPLFAQYAVFVKGEGQVSSFDGRYMCKFSDVATYQVCGVMNNQLAVWIHNPPAPPALAPYTQGRFRVFPISGGTYSSVSVTVSDAKCVSGVRYRQNGFGVRSNERYYVSFTGTLSLPQTSGQCYAAFQWYVGDKPVGATVSVLGTMEANRVYPVDMEIPLEEYEARNGVYSFHVFAGKYEMKKHTLDGSSVGKW